jgi:transcriptional regulator with GAF, ATPase, and Fis domain
MEERFDSGALSSSHQVARSYARLDATADLNASSSEPAAEETPPCEVSVLVSEVSAGFIDLPAAELGQGIDRALKTVGEALGFDRCFVRMFSNDLQKLERVHMWTREATELRTPSTLTSEDLPHCFERILSGHDCIYDALPADDCTWYEEVQRLNAWGVKMVVCMPVRIGRQVRGVVGFVSGKSARKLRRDVLTAMRLTVEIVASALERKREEEERSARQKFDALIGRTARELINAPIDSLDEVVPRALADVGETLGFSRALIFRREPSGSMSYLWHEWLRQGTASVRPQLSRLDRTDHRHIPPAILKGEAAIIDLTALPREATLCRLRGIEHNIRILALAPLINAGRNFGALMLHTPHYRELTSDFRQQLTLLGAMFASIITRIEAEQARERAYQELEALKARIERERDYLREEIRSEQKIGEILGHSAAMREVLDAIAKVATTQATVLIRGESGVGKELLARAIHDQSPRRDGPLVKVNCASVPRELFESEFFGHSRGAFTGAHKDRAGRFELADRGTLFLDEVGDIPLDLQAKLLRVLQEGEYERVGEERTRKANVRVIAATNRDLEEDIRAGRFRGDLYYRLSTFPILVPPLRERGDDVMTLSRHFLTLYARSPAQRELTIEKEQERMLRAYDWPGNVRELQHVIERAVILSSDSMLRLELALPKLPARASSPTPRPNSLPAPLPVARSATSPLSAIEIKRLERDNILIALEQTRWRVAGAGGAATLLGLKPSTLRDRMRALGIDRR